MLLKIISLIVIYMVISYIVLKKIIVDFLRYASIKLEMNKVLYDNDLVYFVNENMREIDKLPQFMVNHLFETVDKSLIFHIIQELRRNDKKELMNKILFLAEPSKDLYDIINYKLPKKLFEIHIKPFLLDNPNGFQLKQYYGYLSNQELFEIASDCPNLRNWVKRVINDKKLRKHIDFIGAIENDSGLNCEEFKKGD